MCGDVSKDKYPERRLAALFKAELNVDLDPQVLRMFVRHNWRLVSTYAHAIHETPTEGTSV